MPSKGRLMGASIRRQRFCWLVVIAVCWLVWQGPAAADSGVTIIATVTDGYQLVGEDGQPYEVENTPKGNELVMNHIGRKVEVTGSVVDEVDYKIVTVDAYRILEEQ